MKEAPSQNGALYRQAARAFLGLLLSLLWLLLLLLPVGSIARRGLLPSVGRCRRCSLAFLAGITTMQSAGSPGNGLVEVLALDGGDLELEGGGLPGAVAGGIGASTPGAAAVDLGEVAQLGEGLCVAKGHVDDAVMGEGGHGSDGRRLLAAARAGGRDEDTGMLAVVAAAGPD